MTNRSCLECAAPVPRAARWCGLCGALVEHLESGGRGRRVLRWGLGAIAVVTTIAVGVVAVARAPDLSAPSEQPTVVDTACDLDDASPTCVSWILNAGVSGTVVTHGIIAIGRDGDLVGHDQESGEERWRTPVTELVGGFDAAPLDTASGIIIVNTRLGGVAGIDPLTGDPVWTRPAETALGSTTPGLIITQRPSGFLAGISALTGDAVWERRLDRRVYPDVQVHDDAVVALRPGGLQVLDRRTGTPRWSANDHLIAVHGAARGGLAVSFAPSPLRAQGRLAVYDLQRGGVLWTRARARGQQVAVGTDAIYTQATNTPLERLAIVDGTSEWNVGSVALVDVPLDGRLLARGVPVMADRWLQLLDLQTGELLQESRVGRDGITQLEIAADGDLVATTPDGLHRFPANGPTRAELDAIGATVLTASPLLVKASGRLVRVDELSAPVTPACTVGLRRARCIEWTIAVDDDHVIAVGDHAIMVMSGALQAVAVDTGATVWRIRVDADPTLVPIHGDANGVVATGRGTVSLDPRDGAVRWRDPDAIIAIEGLADDEVAVRRADRVDVLDTATGAVRRDVGLAPDEELIGFSGANAIVRTTDEDGVDQLAARDPRTGAVSFDRTLVAQQVHVTGDALYLAPHDDGGVYRHDPATGALVWGQPAGELVWSAAQADGPWLVVQEVGIDDARVTAVETGIGAPLWTRTGAPVNDWAVDRSRGMFATSTGLEVVDRSGDLVWEAALGDTTLVSPSPLLVLRDGELLRLRDPS